MALRGLRSALPESLTPTDPEVPVSVRQAFEELGKQNLSQDPLSSRRVVSNVVQQRIEAIPVGGYRHDLPVELQLDCHIKLGAKSAAAGSYARLKWDSPSGTMTTRCTTPASGPFIHPQEHRPITLREAATLQTFPPTYKFVGGHGSVERQIGNAVPVLMATRIATNIRERIS